MSTLTEKIEKVLDDANLNGAVMLVYEDQSTPIVDGRHAVGYVLAKKNFTDAHAVGQITQCIGRMVVEGCIKGRTTGLPDRGIPGTNLPEIGRK